MLGAYVHYEARRNSVLTLCHTRMLQAFIASTGKKLFYPKIVRTRSARPVAEEAPSITGGMFKPRVVGVRPKITDSECVDDDCTPSLKTFTRAPTVVDDLSKSVDMSSPNVVASDTACTC